MMLRILYDVELENASSDQERYGYSAEPPCERDAGCKAGYHQKYTTYCVAEY